MDISLHSHHCSMILLQWDIFFRDKIQWVTRLCVLISTSLHLYTSLIITSLIYSQGKLILKERLMFQKEERCWQRWIYQDGVKGSKRKLTYEYMLYITSDIKEVISMFRESDEIFCVLLFQKRGGFLFCFWRKMKPNFVKVWWTCWKVNRISPCCYIWI